MNSKIVDVSRLFKKPKAMEPENYFHFIDGDDFELPDKLFEELLKTRETPYMICIRLSMDQFESMPDYLKCEISDTVLVTHHHDLSKQVNWERVFLYYAPHFSMQQMKDQCLKEAEQADKSFVELGFKTLELAK